MVFIKMFYKIWWFNIFDLLLFKNKFMKERKYITNINGQYVILTEGEYELYLIFCK